MKTVKQINAIISKLQAEANDLENQAKNFSEQAKTLFNSWKGTQSRFANREDDPEYIRWKALNQAEDNAYIQAAEIRNIITVWRFNLLHAKKAELLPVWCEVMKPYEGKKIGEARKEEIRAKLKALGVAGYFSNYEYDTPKINLAYLDNNGYCFGGDYVELRGHYNTSFFDSDNKFVMPELDSFKFYGEGTPYIENPKQYIRNIRKLAEKAKKAAAAYDKELKAYNNAAIPGFAEIKTYNEYPDHVAKYFRIEK